jgi:hypothetical protein
MLGGGTTDGVSAGGTVGRSAAFEMSDLDTDVIVASDETRVLALSERTLSNLLNDDPHTMEHLAAALGGR